MYRTDKYGNLCTYNVHPAVVQYMYDIKVKVSELRGQHQELDEFIETIESQLFCENGIGFESWIRQNKLRREIDNLEELKVNPWDNSKTVNLKKQIKRLLYRVTR